MTEQDKANHALYEALPGPQKYTVNRAYRRAMQTISNDGFPAAKDDRAEALVAAIAAYVIQSEKPK